MVGTVTDILDSLNHSYTTVQAAIATSYDEVGIAKNTLDNAIKERDKFRADVQVGVLVRTI